MWSTEMNLQKIKIEKRFEIAYIYITHWTFQVREGFGEGTATISVSRSGWTAEIKRRFNGACDYYMESVAS